MCKLIKQLSALFLCLFTLLMSACHSISKNEIASSHDLVLSDADYFEKVMNARPIMPKVLNKSMLHDVSCPAPENTNASDDKFKTVSQSQINLPNWEARISHDWRFIDVEAEDGKLLIIDAKQLEQGLGFRYLANANTQIDLYEPWSSSKIQAYTGAVAKLRQQTAEIGAQATIGDVAIADMITSINAYEITGNSPSDSNALASFFANIAGRDYLSALFYQEWLKLSNSSAFFRGAYGPVAFVPNGDLISAGDKQISLSSLGFKTSYDDPGYLSYRCETCGLTGNKAMYSLAQAEWLKRLAGHRTSVDTRHPFLAQQDVDVLFYGRAVLASDAPIGGMKSGISNMLQIAIAQAISGKNINNDLELAKLILDHHTKGEWRVFQKIGWGISETRSATETVVLAHVCLPYFQGGREFTVAAQAAIKLDADISEMEQMQEYAALGRVGHKMQQNLTRAMLGLLE
jgi:hypothetical protein